MEIIILILGGTVAFLCLGMLGNCLNLMRKVQRKEKDDERTPGIRK